MRGMRRALLLGFSLAAIALPARADWTDFTSGELRIGTTDAVMQLILPTGWVAFADDDGNGTLSDLEVAVHAVELTQRLATRVRITADGIPGVMGVRPPALPPRRLDLATDGRHATLELYYTWREPLAEVVVHYELFTPGVQGARAEITALRDQTSQVLAFTPTQREGRFDGRSRSHRFAMATQLYGRAHLLEGLGVLLLLLGLAYGAWALARGLRDPGGREDKS
ncbi:MAG: hypothetical protein JWM80_2466 [Cyanobacteria bacterium RYN_339]|nr:hypothetical protein [Cyanobacteria bacterium RYN_339]